MLKFPYNSLHVMHLMSTMHAYDWLYLNINLFDHSNWLNEFLVQLLGFDFKETHCRTNDLAPEMHITSINYIIEYNVV